MHSIDLVELKKQQQRYYALLNGAKRGLYAPKMVRVDLMTVAKASHRLLILHDDYYLV